MKDKFDSLIKSGELFFVGEKLPEDFYHAFNIWNVASESENPKVQYNLGYCYTNGEGVQKDLEKGFEYYMKAFDNGILNAGKYLVRLKSLFTIGYTTYLRFFDKNQREENKQILERLHSNLPSLLDFANEIKRRGYNQIDNELIKLNQLMKLVQLDVIYKKESLPDFLSAVDKAIDEGHVWAKQIRAALQSKIVCTVRNTRDQSVSEAGVHNGTTRYAKSKPFYDYSQTTEFQNDSNIPVYVETAISKLPVSIPPGGKGFLLSNKGRSDELYTFDGKKLDWVGIAPFGDTKYFQFWFIDQISLSFTLPFVNETLYENKVQSGFTPAAIIFIAIMAFAMVFCFSQM